MTEKIVIRPCPYCNYYVYMPELSQQRCGHCQIVTDFTFHLTMEQKLGIALQFLVQGEGYFFGRYFCIPRLTTASQKGRLVLLFALPVVLLWLFMLRTVDTSAWQHQASIMPEVTSFMSEYSG